MSFTKNILDEMTRRAGSLSKENKIFLEKLGKNRPKELDKTVRDLHFETFEKIDCIECANCCRSLGPMLFESDIDRMSATLKIKSSVFKDKYVSIDEDGDYVFKEMPCPFLCHDNYCSIYETRSKACREYPHTNRKRFYQVTLKTYHNSLTCPAVYSIVNELKKKF
jgi:Fe-S-cluster containining protein